MNFKRDGDRFSYEWEEQGVSIIVGNLREKHDGLHAEVSIANTLPGQAGHVSWGTINLSSTTARDKLANTLGKRIPAVPWDKFLETVCVKTAIFYRAGEPLINLAEVKPPETTKYLIHRLLPRNSITIIYGDGGSCKSMFALYAGCCLNQGIDMRNGWTVNERAEVLYLDWETCWEDQRERLGAIATGLNQTDPLPSIHYRRMTRRIAEEAPRLRVEVSDRKIGLVVVDSLGPAIGGNLRDEAEVIPAMNALNSLGTTVLAIAHITKADVRGEHGNGKATPLGSVFFANLARNTWEIRRSDMSTDISTYLGFYHRKSNRGALWREPAGIEVCFLGSEARTDCIDFHEYDLAEDPDLAPHAAMGFRIQAALRHGAKTTTTLSEELGIKSNNIAHRAKQMNAVVRLNPGGRGVEALWGLRSQSGENGQVHSLL
ncbi:MAG: AAA family ATPase [Armatimonadota bacterium]|nr:AAA family ATPase [Armatimonadota bacterium]